MAMATAAGSSLHLLPTPTAASTQAVNRLVQLKVGSASISAAKLRQRVPAFSSAAGLKPTSFINLQEDPILKEALKEPVAFIGGLFAGLLRLDLNEEPLKEWVAKTSQAAGVKPEPETEVVDEGPEEIVIE